jgi:hypothetical protein
VLRLLRHTRVPALVALLVMSGSVPLSFAALLHDADDPDCQPGFVQHDERAHRIGGARTIPDVPQHCAVCHWLQSLQTIVATGSVSVATSTVAHLCISSLPVALAQSIGEIPARAPPHA